MDTKVLKAGDEAVRAAAQLLKAGDIVAVPTETVYGLAANALDETAVARIFAAKGRPQDNPLILHICDISMLGMIAKSVPPAAHELAEKFWPGPLTMIFPRKDNIPASTCGGLDTAAVRMPDNVFTLRLIKECGFPLAAPSANTSGLPSPTLASHVFEDMNGKIPLIVDGGKCGFGVESTVICFEGDRARILRPGAVTAEMLSQYCETVVDSAVIKKLEPGKKALSPGMKYKHYSPRAQVLILDGTREQIGRFLAENADKMTAFLGFGDESLPESVSVLPYGADAYSQAENLFSSLREADEKGFATVYVRMPEKSGMGLAVYNRLIRAAAFRILNLTEKMG